HILLHFSLINLSAISAKSSDSFTNTAYALSYSGNLLFSGFLIISSNFGKSLEIFSTAPLLLEATTILYCEIASFKRYTSFSSVSCSFNFLNAFLGLSSLANSFPLSTTKCANTSFNNVVLPVPGGPLTELIFLSLLVI